MARSFTVERQLRGFHAVVIDPVYQVATVISGGVWILETGSWNDGGVWDDASPWNDGTTWLMASGSWNDLGVWDDSANWID